MQAVARACFEEGKPCVLRPKATHSLTCGAPDRESNEIKYLREATEVMKRWQQQLEGGQPVSKAPSEHGEVILIERQW